MTAHFILMSKIHCKVTAASLLKLSNEAPKGIRCAVIRQIPTEFKTEVHGSMY